MRYGAVLVLAATACGLAVVGGHAATSGVGSSRDRAMAERSFEPGVKLTPIGEAFDGNFGISVALSARGTTAFVGGSGDNGDIGAAWVFGKTRRAWRQRSPKLTPLRQLDAAAFGLRVALSADGNVAVIGGPLEDGGNGAAWIFEHSGPTWRQRAKLLPRGAAGRPSFGESVALSADGRIAIVGGPTDHFGTGGAWVFVRSGATWTQEGKKLIGKGEVGPGRVGVSVALSSDGKTAAVGAPLDTNDAGAAWIFRRSGSTWLAQGPKLRIKGMQGQAQFGSSVALSANGSTVLVGAPVDGGDVGTAWVFKRSGAAWRQQGGKLAPSGKPGTVQFGGSVALTGAGSTALIGGASDNGDVGKGAAWVFARHGNTWSQQAGEPLTGRRENGRGGFGSSVALSTDGTTALVGGYNDDDGRGAAWEFHR